MVERANKRAGSSNWVLINRGGSLERVHVVPSTIQDGAGK